MNSQLSMQFASTSIAQKGIVQSGKSSSKADSSATSSKTTDSFAKVLKSAVNSADDQKTQGASAAQTKNTALAESKNDSVNDSDAQAVDKNKSEEDTESSKKDDDKKTDDVANLMAMLQNILAMLQNNTNTDSKTSPEEKNGGDVQAIQGASSATVKLTEDIQKLLADMKKLVDATGTGSVNGKNSDTVLKLKEVDPQFLEKLQGIMNALGAVTETNGDSGAENENLSAKLMDAAAELAKLSLKLEDSQVNNHNLETTEKTALSAVQGAASGAEQQKTPVTAAKTIETAKDTADTKSSVGAVATNTVQANEVNNGGSSESKNKSDDEKSKDHLNTKQDTITDSSGNSLFKVEQKSVLGDSNTVATVNQQSPAADANDVIAQMKDKINFDRLKNMHEVTMKLNPDSLGELKIHLSLTNGSMEAKFVTETSSVRQALEANLDILKKQLEDQGIQVQKLSVSVGGSFDSRQFNQQEQGQQWGSSWQQQNNNSLLTRQNAGNYGDQGLLAEEIDSNSQTDLTSLAYGSNVSYAI